MRTLFPDSEDDAESHVTGRLDIRIMMRNG